MSNLESLGLVILSVQNSDTGSLHALPPGALKPEIGTQILLEGEEKPRTVTYIMGSATKGWHFCTKGQGKFPVGTVRFCILSPEPVTVPSDDSSDE